MADMSFVWHLVFGLVALVSLLQLLSLPTRHAAVVATTFPPPPEELTGGDRARPLMSRIMARRLLEVLPEESHEPPDVTHHSPHPLRAKISPLAALNRSATPQISLCRAPSCGDADMLMLTVLHARAPLGPAHAPHIALLERWSRPAHSLLAPPRRPTAHERILSAALREGDGGAVRAALGLVREALGPTQPGVVDPYEWQLLWRAPLPGPAALLVSAADEEAIAVNYEMISGEGAAQPSRGRPRQTVSARASWCGPHAQRGVSSGFQRGLQ